MKFADKPPIEKLRSALEREAWRNAGSAGDDRAQRGDHRDGVARRPRAGAGALAIHRNACVRTFGQQQSGKLDLNNAGVQAIVDRLRVLLQSAGCLLSEQQLQDVATASRIFAMQHRAPACCAASTSCRECRV